MNNIFVSLSRRAPFNKGRTLFYVWMTSGLVYAIVKLLMGKYNNYKIFEYVFPHVVNGQHLYIEYPAEYYDLNHYGPLFAFVIAPFSLMPEWLGMIAWVLANTLFLFYAIKQLPLSSQRKIIIGWFSLCELMTAQGVQQFNISVAAFIIVSFVMTSTVSMNLATIFKLRGINMTISAACASGSHAIGLGYLLISQGVQEMILCGGAQEVNVYSMGSFDGLGVFSVRIENPTTASRPFDASRDGLVPSGGAASLILEEYEHALKRGATIYGEVLGYGFSSNGEQISQASEVGSAISMQRALDASGLKPSDIDYINAHA